MGEARSAKSWRFGLGGARPTMAFDARTVRATALALLPGRFGAGVATKAGTIRNACHWAPGGEAEQRRRAEQEAAQETGLEKLAAANNAGEGGRYSSKQPGR